MESLLEKSTFRPQLYFYYVKNVKKGISNILVTVEMSKKSISTFDTASYLAKQLIVHGNEPEKIVKIAKKHQLDLIIIRFTGKYMVKELIFGSISNYVMQHSDVLVLLVKETSAKLETKINYHVKNQRKDERKSKRLKIQT